MISNTGWIGLPSRDDLDRRQAQPFLKDLRRLAGQRAGRHAADVGIVGDVGGPGDQRASAKTGIATTISFRCVTPP
jgi:hypothetical protein